MILKMFRDRQRTTGLGWFYVDEVRDVHVDANSWGIMRSEGSSPYVICGRKGLEPNKETKLAGYEVLFDTTLGTPDDGHWEPVIVITMTLRDESERMFVKQLGEPSAWLMSDEGKTIERLS